MPWRRARAILSMESRSSRRKPPVVLPSTNVAWLPAAADADIERAFAQARSREEAGAAVLGRHLVPALQPAQGHALQPAGLCRAVAQFVAVHVDGDRPGAQKLGRRFKVSGYPTVVLFGADGRSSRACPARPTPPGDGRAAAGPGRWPAGEGRAGRRPGRQALGRQRMAQLAFYSWDTDDQQLLPKAEVPATLARLAVASPAAPMATTKPHAPVAQGAGRQRRGPGCQARRRPARACAARAGRPGAVACADGRPDQRRGRHREGA
jgi:hypothetical protein